MNPNLTMEFINANPDKPWDWIGISSNPNLAMEFIANPDKPWSWWHISCNPNIKLQDIFANSDKPWNWEYISQNSNITIEIIEANPDKICNWTGLSVNKFTKSKTDFITQKYCEHLSAYRIQLRWHKIRLDPRHPVGRRRIEREYAKLFISDQPTA
jgi:hypothetical protein